MKETPQDSSALSTADFMKTFLENHRPPQETVDYFQQLPWLNKYLSSPLYEVIPTYSRHLKSSGEDYFFSRTINTPSTVPHMISVQLRDFTTPDSATADSPSPSADPLALSHKQQTVVPENPDVCVLISIGQTGLDGHPSTLHGGVTCAILDESMGVLVMLHHNSISGPGARDSLYTANLNVSYRAPIPTPGEVLVKTWLVRRQGRKWYSIGQIVDKDGQLLAEGRGVWVIARRDKI